MTFLPKRISRISLVLYIIAAAFVVIGVVNVIEQLSERQKHTSVTLGSYFDYFAGPGLIAIFLLSLGIGLQYLFDIRNHILSDAKGDADA